MAATGIGWLTIECTVVSNAVQETGGEQGDSDLLTPLINQFMNESMVVKTREFSSLSAACLKRI
ncbi:hypothetical protein [Serratia liquefaciens]|uniref:hypothetical protein n=1 Tax=Serratia liquefaciens TaxID=614 RepID=UPI0021BA7119|nr:hypothetical protein [Serratia liquefaciens]HDS5481631.1 hypothetical protein [Serratia liquefaciens]HDU8661013.1 hypothetical protein [Serratia liquefaciens]